MSVKQPSVNDLNPAIHGIRFVRRAAVAVAALAAWLTPSASSHAVLLHFVADPINSANECPACNENGLGCAALTLDTATGVVNYRIAHTQAGETMAHVHGPAGLCPATAGILVPLPVGLLKIGAYNLTPAQQTDMMNQLHYINVHTGVCPSGAIRGQIVRAQNPEACCLPDGTCMDTDRATCICLGGVPGGPGSVCLGDADGNMIDDACEYKNWVIADDFCFNPQCPDCICDFDGDGQCTTFLDLQMLLNCFGPVTPACQFADLNCDGVVDNADENIWVCLAGGNPPDLCCPTPPPPPPPPPVITDVQWYGSYLDPDFDPLIAPMPRPIDGWLVALHRDIPPIPCPPGANFDMCGIIANIGAAGCQTFTPNGSATPIPLDVFNLCCAVGLPGPFPLGEWRICGIYDPNCVTPCSPVPGTLCVLDIRDCQTGISRPAKLIAQWVFPGFLVQPIETGKVGWDGHQIYCYGPIRLENGCLAHNNAGLDEINPLFPGIFHPRAGEVYWISIQAEVGHFIQPLPQPCCLPGGGCVEVLFQQCVAMGGIPQPGGQPCPLVDCLNPGPPALPYWVEEPTGHSVDKDFWGWHTTPPGYHNKDDAFMGSLAMGCRGGWLYHWMNELHWSQPNYFDCADDPTKSMDMAFYLICSNGPAGKQGEIVWCQPINPGPPPPGDPPAPPRDFPEGGIDEFARTVADVQMNIFQFGPVAVNNAIGPTRVWRDNPVVVGPNVQIQTELLSMNLVGISPLGPATIIERPDAHSFGLTQGPLAMPFPAQSFFDVFPEILIPGAPPALDDLITLMPVPVQAVGGIWEIPPSSADYQGPPGPIFLYDRGDLINPVGELIFVSHRINYFGGINVHSDVDWAKAPMECTCKGDLNTDGLLNAADIHQFIDCLLGGGGGGCPCDCADMDDDGVLDFGDVDAFVNQMLQVPKVVCPPDC